MTTVPAVRAALLLFACALAAGCDRDAACRAAQIELSDKAHRVPPEHGWPEEARLAIEAGIDAVNLECDATDFEVGRLLVTGYSQLGDQNSVGRVYLHVSPRTPEEQEMLAFEATKFFVETGQRQNAAAQLAELKRVSRDEDYLDAGISMYECRFGRCALVEDRLRRQATKHTAESRVHVMFGYALADQHRFEEAAKEFDIVANRFDFDAFDIDTAQVAVASWANTGQHDKARTFIQFYENRNMRVTGVNDQAYARMESMASDTTGRQFLLSEWPIPEKK